MEYSKIATERKKLGLSQKELAIKIGVYQKSISKYERGVSRPTYETLIAMAKLFDVSLDYLLNKDNSLSTKKITDISEDEYKLVLLYRKFQKEELTDNLLKSLNTFFPNISIVSILSEIIYINSFRQLNEDNQDIIIGEMKKYLKEQRYETAKTNSNIEKTGA